MFVCVVDGTSFILGLQMGLICEPILSDRTRDMGLLLDAGLLVCNRDIGLEVDNGLSVRIRLYPRTDKSCGESQRDSSPDRSLSKYSASSLRFFWGTIFFVLFMDRSSTRGLSCTRFSLPSTTEVSGCDVGFPSILLLLVGVSITLGISGPGGNMGLK